MEHKRFKEKVANMTTSEKIKYIWYYYKFHIIGTIVAIVMITSFAVDAAKTKQSALSVTLMGVTVDSNKLTALQDKATAALVKDSKKKQIKLDFLIYSKDPKDQSAAIQKLTAMVAAADIDILVLNKNDFENYAKQGMFQSLDSVPGFSNLKLSSYDTVKYKVDGKDIAETVYGIMVDKLPAFLDAKFDTKDKILCVVSNSKHTDKISEFLNWLFSQI